MEHGNDIVKMLKSHDYWKIKEAERILDESEQKYRENKQKKWFFAIFGFIIGGLLGFYVPAVVEYIQKSFYDRTELDKIIDQMVGGINIQDSLTDEVMIVAYSFDMQQPRFYSK